MAGDLAARRLRVFYVSSEPSRSPLMPRLQALGRHLTEVGLADGGAVLSARYGKRVVVTTSTAQLAMLRPDDVVELVDYDPQRHRCVLMGRSEPAQYAGVHWLVYNHREEVHGIVQFRDPLIADVQEATKMFPEAPQKPLGSVDMGVEALKLLRKGPFIVLKGHGCLATGRDLDEAWRVAAKAHAEAVAVVEEAGAMGEDGAGGEEALLDDLSPTK